MPDDAEGDDALLYLTAAHKFALCSLLPGRWFTDRPKNALRARARRQLLRDRPDLVECQRGAHLAYRLTAAGEKAHQRELAEQRTLVALDQANDGIDDEEDRAVLTAAGFEFVDEAGAWFRRECPQRRIICPVCRGRAFVPVLVDNTPETWVLAHCERCKGSGCVDE